MEKVTLGQTARVLLDHCPSHGLWFDHGELGSLMGQMAAAPGSHPEAALRFMGETFTAAPSQALAGKTESPEEVKR